MKIAFDVMKISGHTGNQVYTSELIKALEQFFPENQYHIITHWHRRAEARKVLGESPSLRYRNILPNETILGKGLKSYVTALNDYLQASVSKSFDLYHCTNPLRFPGQIKNVAVTLHDLAGLRDEPWTMDGSRSKSFYVANIKRILERSKVVFTVSNYTKEDAVQRFPEYNDKFVVTPLAANPLFQVQETDRNFLARFGVRDVTKPFLLYIGEIQPRKNVVGMLKAFDALPETIRKEVNFVLIGKARNKQNQEELNSFLPQLSSREQIIQVPGVTTEDLVSFYNAALGFVYVSFFEGFGLPVVEAMSCGCPVLTSNTTSLREVSENAALSVNPNDQEEIREAMKRLIDDSELRSQLRQKGLQRASEYSWEKTARKTMDGYRQALKSVR